MKFKRLGMALSVSVVFVAIICMCLSVQAEEEGPKQLKVTEVSLDFLLGI